MVSYGPMWLLQCDKIIESSRKERCWEMSAIGIFCKWSLRWLAKMEQLESYITSVSDLTKSMIDAKLLDRKDVRIDIRWLCKNTYWGSAHFTCFNQTWAVSSPTISSAICIYFFIDVMKTTSYVILFCYSISKRDIWNIHSYPLDLIIFQGRTCAAR